MLGGVIVCSIHCHCYIVQVFEYVESCSSYQIQIFVFSTLKFWFGEGNKPLDIISFSLNITEYIFICVMSDIYAIKGCLINVIFLSFKINFVITMSVLEMGHISLKYNNYV